jgi:hypothetical protein
MDPSTPYCRELASPNAFQTVLSVYALIYPKLTSSHPVTNKEPQLDRLRHSPFIPSPTYPHRCPPKLLRDIALFRATRGNIRYLSLCQHPSISIHSPRCRLLPGDQRRGMFRRAARRPPSGHAVALLLLHVSPCPTGSCNGMCHKK